MPIHRKIAKVEEEIAEACSTGSATEPGLFENPALRALKDRLVQLREVAEGIEKKLGMRQN